MELIPQPEPSEIVFDETAEAEVIAQWLEKVGFEPDPMADFTEFIDWE